MTRLPMIPEDKLTDAQRKAVQAVTAGKRAGVRGPFPALLRSPELCEKAAVLGEMMRFNTSLPPRLSEMAILITAYNWKAQYEWFAHAPLAQKGGLADDIIQRLQPVVGNGHLVGDKEPPFDILGIDVVGHMVDHRFQPVVAVGDVGFGGKDARHFFGQPVAGIDQTTCILIAAAV